MRYVLKQKFWTLGQSFSIKNADDRELAVVDGNIDVSPNRLTFADPQGTEYASITRNGQHSFIVARGQENVAWIAPRADGDMKRQRFRIDMPMRPDLKYVETLGLMRAFELRRGEVVVAAASQQPAMGGDLYHVDIPDTEDAVLILAIVIVIDLMLDA